MNLNKKLYFSEFVLKIIGIVLMTLDHIGLFLQMSPFIESGSAGDTVAFAFRCVGRLAMPIFLFMLAEGMHKTHDRANYLLRLASIWAILFVAEFILYLIQQTQFLTFAQPFTDLLMCALFIYFLEKKGWWKILSLLPLGWIILSYAAGTANSLTQYDVTWTEYFPSFCWAGYSLFALLIFLGFYYAPKLAELFMKNSPLIEEIGWDNFKESSGYQWLKNLIGCGIFVIVVVVLWGISYLSSIPDPLNMSLQTYCLIAFPLLFLYNGKRGYDKKWWRYANYFYYPVHIIILGVIFGLIILL